MHSGRPLLVPDARAPIEPGPVPTFSVIIAAYQAADFVADAVASVLGQTVQPVEVIVCDDGSTDDIEGALLPFMDRIEFLRRDHDGEAAAKNAAANAASGEFVALLDADDRYLPERLEALGELAALRPDLDVLTTDALLEWDGQVVGRYYGESWSFEVSDQRRALLERNFIFSAPAVRRSTLLAAGGFDESITFSMDWECWLRVVFSGSSVGLVDEPLYLYRIHEGAQSSQPAGMRRGEADSLERAASKLELTDGERAALDRSLATRRRDADLEEARQALLERAPDARRRSLDVARGSGYGFPTRVKAVMGAIAPGLIGRFLLFRRRRRWGRAPEFRGAR